MNKEKRYEQLIEAVIKNKLETRYDVVCYCVGFCGEVNLEILELLNKLYAEGYIKA